MEDDSNAGVDEDLEGAVEEDKGVEDDESLSSEDSEADTDWKAIAEKEREKAENYRKALDQKRQLRKKTPSPVVEDESDEDDDDKPLTKRDLRAIQEAITVKPSVDTILAEKVKDPNKRDLVKTLYETRIQRTGTSDADIRADLEEAIDLADSKANKKKASEMARVLNQGKTVPMAGSAADRGKGPQAHKFSAEQVKTLTESAKRLNADPAKFIETAWKNQKGR